MQSVATYYAANSYGAIKNWQTSVAAVTGPFDSASYCANPEGYDWTIRGLVAGATSYLRLVIVIPGCSWYAISSVGVEPVGGNKYQSVVRISDWALWDVVLAHELGHSLGVFHSHGESCDSVGCVVDEYGDEYDLMGHGDLQHFAAFQKWLLGWMDRKVRTVVASGVYQLTDFLSSARGDKAIRYGDWWIEYRAGLGVLVRTGGVGGHCNDSKISDLDPGPNVDHLLDVGQTYSDGANITVTSLGAGLVQVQVLP
jgi:hypothetical protein